MTKTNVEMFDLLNSVFDKKPKARERKYIELVDALIEKGCTEEEAFSQASERMGLYE